MNSQPQQGHLQRTPTSLDTLNVDFDALLGSLNGAQSGSTSATNPANNNVDDFDIFSAMGAQHDPGAIFVPVENANDAFGSSSGAGGVPAQGA